MVLQDFKTQILQGPNELISKFEVYYTAFEVINMLKFYPKLKTQLRITNIWLIIIIIIIIIQPLGQFVQDPEPSQATGMALVCCILSKFLGVVCHCFPPRLDVPTFAARCLHVPTTRQILAAKCGTMDEKGCPLILPKCRFCSHH